MRNKSTGRPNVDPDPFIPRVPSRFAITETTNPKKLARWFRRGGECALSPAKLTKAAARHIHPRHKRFA